MLPSSKMISARIILNILVLVMAALFLARIAGLVSTHSFGNAHGNGLVPLFDFNEEQSVPTWFSAALLLICASLLGIIAAAQRREGGPYRWWTTLAFVFLYLSMDEALSLHERLNRPVRDLFNTSGALYYAWVIPYAAFALLLLVFSIRPLKALSKSTRNLLVVSGVLFVCGAMGLEVVGSYLATSNKMQATLLSDLVMTLEELMELSGTIILVYALMKQIAHAHPGWGVTIRD
jgi:hypothetical protein